MASTRQLACRRPRLELPACPRAARRRGPFTAWALAALVAAPLAGARVEIVLDVSGSMRASAGNLTRMQAAQQAVKATVEAIDASSNVALRLYGHRLPSEPKAASCEDTELVIPFGPLDRQRFVAAVEQARPLGQTPLAYSLQRAAADFGDLGDEPAAVILVSDGEESCGGDPAQVACAFRERGLELTVHTVGFDVGAVARQQLQAIAQCTGGQYRDARNAGELADSLRQLTQAGLLVDKQREVLGREVRGGNGFASAVPIVPGTYRLDHHQRPSEYDYFSIEVPPGRLLRVSQEAYEVGVTIEGGTFSENQSPTAGVAVHGPDRARISHDAKISPGSKAFAGVSVTAGKGGTFYILVGHDVWPSLGIHQASPITVEIVDASDAGSGTDAGDREADAAPIAAGTHRAWLQPGDGEDVFTFDAAPGATYALRVKPEQEPWLRVTVADEDRVIVAEGSSANAGAAVRLDGIRPPRAGRLYLRVATPSPPHDDSIPYTVELTAAGAAAAAATPAEAEQAAAAAAAGETPAAGRSFGDVLRGGGLACAAAVVVALLGLAAVAVVLFLVIRRRRRGK